MKALFTRLLVCRRDATPIRPRVTPDEATAAELERRRQSLSYQPENGFLIDQSFKRDLAVTRQ